MDCSIKSYWIYFAFEKPPNWTQTVVWLHLNVALIIYKSAFVCCILDGYKNISWFSCFVFILFSRTLNSITITMTFTQKHTKMVCLAWCYNWVPNMDLLSWDLNLNARLPESFSVLSCRKLFTSLIFLAYNETKCVKA